MSENPQGPDFSPLYRQVKELLLQRVVTGHWKPGEILPSETKLAREFNVSQGTVRKALEEMAAEHLVVRHQGKGTFVAARGAGQPVHFFNMTTADHKPVGSRINGAVTYETGFATAKEQEALGIGPDSEVLRVSRVRLIGKRPTLFDEIVLQHDRFPGFADHLDKGIQTNTYVIMEKEYGVLVVRAEEWVSAEAAGPLEAEMLEVKPGTPVLKIHRISYGLDGAPVELRNIWVDTSDCHYYNIVS